MQPDAAGYDAEAKKAVKALAQELGFDRVGITSAEPFEDAEEIALERVRGGLMDGLPWYHEARVKRGASPTEILPGARSIISLAMSYNVEDEEPDSGRPVLRGKVARYARGRDYHGVMQRRLKQLVATLSERIGRPVQARVYVDTGPMQDRAVAERAGVGWFGKNTNVLSPGLGSWVFLGQVLTDLHLEPDAPLRKTCGRCTICIDDCPTGALIAPYVLDNTKCISYLTIELRGPIPRHLRPLVGDWVFGCDICQDVCPVNRKAQPTREPEFRTGEHGFAAMDLLPLLSMSESEFKERFAGSAIRRAKYDGMLRNACVALGNIGDPRAIPALANALGHESSLVRGHAAWALGVIGGEDARAALESAQVAEADADVREEIEAALAAAC
ncbi:MAG: tRNA epoxyqueuosine(34) reductase QueG [Chloroflexota bacterium]|nr:tRNA epoxyqueuosine(34) reductase QueG [Chloroflexota bacterium]MDE2941623.1 tRNA epoxyqueuosine(34) reductase QueG [Chloroflexota bacterium]MDE3267242.1 tRNA epoxyqueuosine(34) reductase QueG [Chloroflexota bacterium]